MITRVIMFLLDGEYLKSAGGQNITHKRLNLYHVFLKSWKYA
jgi:hypothetical protein